MNKVVILSENSCDISGSAIGEQQWIHYVSSVVGWLILYTFTISIL